MYLSGEVPALFIMINNSDEVTMKAVHQFMGNSQIIYNRK